MPSEISFQMPRPGKAVIGVMVAVLAIWVLFSTGINWGGAKGDVLQPFIGISDAVLHGQIWRLFTATLIHDPKVPSHILTTLAGLYFLAPTLEDRWGPKKMLLFLFGSSAFAFAVQVLIGVIIPVFASPGWFGGLCMVDAVAVAWALNHRHGVVRLFFVLPISGTMLLAFIFLMNVLNVIALNASWEGLIAPFAAMLAGYLFGDASPLRRYWLKLRLRRLQAENAALRSASARRREAPFRVIEGGGDRPKDKRYLN